MRLFLFGPPSRRLFGAYHAPHASADVPHCVILCAPMGQEAIWSHRAFWLLCKRLVLAGLHVLRFDYFGCGDSAGASDEGDAQQWTEDINTAIEQMRTLHPLSELSVIGLRLGASLAALVAAKQSDIKNLVLWEPVVNGRAYLQDELAHHREFVMRLQMLSELDRNLNEASEIRGYPLTHVMRDTIDEIDLLTLGKLSAQRTVIVEREANGGGRRLQEHLARLDVKVDHRHVAGPQIWRSAPDLSVVPTQTLECIIEWFSRVDQ